MKVFLDTNVMIDIADDKDNALLIETILNLGKAGKIQNCVSGLHGVLHSSANDGKGFPVELLPEQLT